MTSPWLGATTLEDIAERIVDFLEGRIDFTPVHCGEPYEETLDDAPMLVRLNRAGFITLDSQAGCDGQRAYVDGVMTEDTLNTLRSRLCGSDLVLVHGYPMCDEWVTIPVSLDYEGEPGTFLGRLSGEEHDRHFVDHCGEQVRAAIAESWPVSVFDPIWGRNDRLLPELVAILEAVD